MFSNIESHTRQGGIVVRQNTTFGRTRMKLDLLFVSHDPPARLMGRRFPRDSALLPMTKRVFNGITDRKNFDSITTNW